jgi:hypothetical protein
MIILRQKQYTYLLDDYTTLVYNNKEVPSFDDLGYTETVKKLSKKEKIIDEIYKDCGWLKSRGFKKKDLKKLINKLYKVIIKRNKYIELRVYFDVPGFKMEWLTCRYSLDGQKLNHWNTDIIE